MRPATQKNQATRENIKYSEMGKRVIPSAEEVKLSNFAKTIKEAKYRRGANLHLCGNLTQIYMHIKSA